MKARFIAWLVDALVVLNREAEARAVTGCTKAFRVFGHTCGATKVLPIRCNHPLCPACALERTALLRKKVLCWLKSRPNPCRFLTLTVVNVPRIDRAYLDWLVGSFKKLRALKVWENRVLGGVYSIDTTYNRMSHTWHVHLHVLIEIVKPTERERRLHWYKPWTQELRAEWQRITGSWVIHMRGVDRRAVNELIKYQAKAATFVDAPELVGEYLTAFYNVRRIQTFGSFFGLDFDDDSHLWDCKCGSKGFDSWVSLMSAGRDDLNRDDDGQYVLKLPEVWWGMAGVVIGESPPAAESPPVLPVVEVQAQFQFA